MNGKSVILALLLLLSGIGSYAQTFLIQGTVINSANEAAVGFAETILLQNDSVVKSAMTDENGYFSLLAQAGNYTLFIRQFGDTLYIRDYVLSQNIDLGTVKVAVEAKMLQEITVTAKKKLVEQKTDRLVFNVENSISAIGGTALDMLKITPRLSMRNEKVTMIGKSGIRIMIDDRIVRLSGNSLANYLKSIDANNIKSIEIIANPPAKYEAEGNMGIINIRLKQTAPDSWSASVMSSYKQSEYGKGSVNGRFTYKKNKITVSSNVGYTNGSDGATETNIVYYPKQTFYNENSGRYFANAISGKFGIDYKFTKNLTIGLQYSGIYSEPESKSKNTGILTNPLGQLTETIKTNLNNAVKNNYNTFNFHTIYNIDSAGKKLTLDVDYFNYWKNNNQTYATTGYDNEGITVPNSFSSLNNTGKQIVENYSAKIDIEHPLQWIKLNYGGKLSRSTTNNSLEYYNLSSGSPVPDNENNNKFIYKENTQAIYISASKSFNKKWSAQSGLRMENTQTEGNSLTINRINENNYLRIFPTAYIAFTPDDNNSFSLNYGKRISRPRFSFLNPFRTYASTYSYSEGNPFLQPSSRHNVEFGYTFKNLNISLYYSKAIDDYGFVTLVDTASLVQASSPLNYYTSDNYGVNVNCIFNKLKWIETTFSGNLSYSK
jgi:outer membrane receptor protein involved in Fe transport